MLGASQISTSLCKLRAQTKALQTTTMTTAPSSSTSAPMEAESNPGAENGINLLLPATGLTLVISINVTPAATSSSKAPSSSSATMAANLVPATGAVAHTKVGPSEAVSETKAPSSSSATMAANLVQATGAAVHTKAGPSEAVPATKTPSSSSATMAANLVQATGAAVHTKAGPSEAVPATKAPSSSSATMAANLVPATGTVAHTKAGQSEAALFWVSGTSPLAGSRGWMAGPSFLNPEQLNLAPPSSPERANHLYKTRLCVYDRENCPDGENCEFAHSEAEIRLPTRLIDGVCRYGEGCPYGARCFYRYH